MLFKLKFCLLFNKSLTNTFFSNLFILTFLSFNLSAKLGKDVLTTITNIHTNGTANTRIICLQFISSFLESILNEMNESSLSEEEVVTSFGDLHLKLADILKQSLGFE